MRTAGFDQAGGRHGRNLADRCLSAARNGRSVSAIQAGQMRLITFAAGFLVAFLIAATVASNVFRPPAASTRLAGVSVAVIGYTVTDLGERRHRLNLTVTINSL